MAITISPKPEEIRKEKKERKKRAKREREERVLVYTPPRGAGNKAQESRIDSQKKARGKGSRVAAHQMTPTINEPMSRRPLPHCGYIASPATRNLVFRASGLGYRLGS